MNNDWWYSPEEDGYKMCSEEDINKIELRIERREENIEELEEEIKNKYNLDNSINITDFLIERRAKIDLESQKLTEISNGKELVKDWQEIEKKIEDLKFEKWDIEDTEKDITQEKIKLRKLHIILNEHKEALNDIEAFNDLYDENNNKEDE